MPIFYRVAVAPLLALLLVGGCTQTSGPSLNEQYGGVPLPPEGLGRIYVYRGDFPMFSALAPDVIINGQKVGEAAFASLFHRDAKPGRYEAFLTSDEENPVYFYLAAGQSQFLKAFIDLRVTGTKIALELVPEAQGRGEVADLNTEDPVAEGESGVEDVAPAAGPVGSED